MPFRQPRLIWASVFLGLILWPGATPNSTAQGTGKMPAAKSQKEAQNAPEKEKGRRPGEAPMEYSRQPDLENVSYGPHPRNVLDLWKAKSDQPTPAVVYFHPGGFNHGDRRGGTTGLPPELLEACLAKGISVAAANYRLSSQAPYPTQMEDGARAIQFLRYHAKEWNLNPRAMAAEGGSAGADTSLWLAFRDDMADPASTDPVKRQSTRLPVVGCVDAQCSLDPRVIAKIVDENTARVMGTMALATLFGLPKDEDLMKAERSFPLFEDASAVNHLKPGASPAFLYYTGPPRPAPTGDRNTDVHSIRFGYYLKERMDKLGIECVLRHSGEYTGDRKAQFYGDMVDFFLKHFPGKGE